jgi:hypothetical protein
MNALVKFNVAELVKIRDGLQEKEEQLLAHIEKISAAKGSINGMLKEYKGLAHDTIVMIPSVWLENLSPATKNTKNKFNWKKAALEIITEHDGFLSTESIYKKAKLKYPIELVDRRTSMKNFSSALVYLKNDGKINRHQNRQKEYLYGLSIKHFDIHGKPRPEYMK